MKRRFLAILLVLGMTLSLIGCKSDNSGDDKETDSNKTSKTETGDTGTTGEDDADVDYAFGAFDETVTISTVTSEYASATYPEGDDVTSNVWTRAYKDELNIELVTNWVSDEYDTKLNLDITSGLLPDVFHVNATQLQQLIDADMIWDLTVVFDQYASDRVKGYMEADQASYESGMIDGKLYGVPQMHWGIIDQPDYIWIRNDWKEELNIEDPKSMEDVKNITLKFMENYGGYGMAVDETLDYLNLLATAWHAYPDMWITGEDGDIVYGSAQPEMKNALAEWAEWYELGIINPDFATTDFNAMVEGVVAGNVGVSPFYQWWGYNPGVDTVTNLGGEAVFYPYMIPSADDEEVLQSIFFANGSYTVVSKNCKNPEAAIKMLNYYGYIVDDSSGVEDAETISAFTDNDMAHVVGAMRVLNPKCDYEQYAQVSKALETGDTSGFTTSGMWQKYNNSVEYLENGTPSAIGDFLQQGAEKTAYGLATQILDSEKYIKSKLWGATPEALLNYGSTLDDILTEGFTKIVMGVEDIEYFDTAVANWWAAGGETATVAMNEAYGE